MTTIKRTMLCLHITFTQNGIKKEIKHNYFNNYERLFMCKKKLETLLYRLNYNYTLYNNTFIYFNNMIDILNQLPYPYYTIVNNIILSQPVNDDKTCFLHMLYNDDNHFTIIIEERTLNKVLEIVFYDEIKVIPLIN